MSTIKGIFEPFKQYVQKQLRVRKVLLANAKPLYIDDGEGGVTPGPKDLSYGFDLPSRSNVYPEESFWAYTVEKQAFIRMMSGVDIRQDATGILQEEEADPKLSYLRWNPQALAKQYILESGTQYYNEGGEHGGQREGFSPLNNTDYERAFSYGDKNVRANADADFGVVPMPGIVDAEIRTKSDNGSLREAVVNFVCHNRRQLEVLEMLYMRPGYPICLEWGWNPYIDNDGNKKENHLSIREEFFKTDESLESLNESIRKYKKESGGNFDGFIGYCKNFKFKANELGGYECTTEIIAHGEILESLKSTSIIKDVSNLDQQQTLADLEIEDSLLWYLRSIKFSIRSPQNMSVMKDAPISANEWAKHGGLDKTPDNIKNYEQIHGASAEIGWDEMRTDLGYAGDGCPSFYRGRELIGITYPQVDKFICIYEGNVQIPVMVKTTDRNFSPKPYDQYKAEDQSVELKVTKEIASNYQFEQWQYQHDQGNFDYMYDFTHFGLGDMKDFYETPIAGDVTMMLDYSTTTWLQSTDIGGFFINVVDYIEGDSRWGTHRDFLISKGIKAQKADFSSENRATSMNEFNENLKLIDDKLKNYKFGYLDVINLWEMINKTTLSTEVSKDHLPNFNWNNKKPYGELDDEHKYYDPNLQGMSEKFVPSVTFPGIGFESFLGGSILKQTVKHDETPDDTGYRMNVFIRWDLLCQMINHLSTYGAERSSDIIPKLLKGDGEITNSVIEELKKKQKNFKLQEADMEFTYMNPNRRTWNNKKKKTKQDNSFYLPYTAPYVTDTDPIKDILVPRRGEDIDTDLSYGEAFDEGSLPGGSTGMMDQYQPDGVDYLGNPLPLENRVNFYDLNVPLPYSTVKKKTLQNGDYHPLIGASLDESICIMPHQPVFDSLFENDKVYYDNTPMGTYYFDAAHSKVIYNEAISRKDDEFEADDVDLSAISSYKTPDGKNIIKNSPRHSIGLVYFNLDFVIRIFEEQRLLDLEAKTLQKHVTLNEKFNKCDFVTSLWEGVNKACGGYYNFIIHTEHERPHINRIIDLRVSGKVDKDDEESFPIFTFEPQGLKSVTRQFYYDSAISNDMASAIAIAASNPKDMQEVDALSFKAFNKNIKSRFNKYDEVDPNETKTTLKELLITDIEKYANIYNALTFYLLKLYEGNFQEEKIKTKEGSTIGFMSMGSALGYIKALQKLRTNINNRVPLKNKDGEDNDDAGRWLTEVTSDISPIIPIQFNIQLDGIAGLIPLQIFQISPERLPAGYDQDSIAFIIKSESHKITNTQDWTVNISGQMCIMNTNPNTGKNLLDTAGLNINALPPGYGKSEGSVEDVHPNADAVRDYLPSFGHIERTHVGSKGPEYTSGELSSGGDITLRVREMIIKFIWQLNMIIPTQKLEFTGGNDIYHHKLFPSSRHTKGEAVDFILINEFSYERLDQVIDVLLEVKEDFFPALKIKDEYRPPGFDNGRHKDLYAKNEQPKHIHLQF